MNNPIRPVEPTSPPCVLCGHAEKVVLFEATDYITHNSFRLIQCQICKLVETMPKPMPAEMARYYPDEYFGLSGRRFLRPGEWVIRLARVWRAEAIHRLNQAPGRILDIGCGRGWMLAKLGQLGWDCYGTEWSETLVNLHRQNGLQVFREIDLRDCHFADQYFDVVTLWHVFEHLYNPSEILAEIRRVLRPGGLIVLATPDFGGLGARLARQSWFALDVPRHLYHYSHKTLPDMLEAAGFRVFRRRYLSIEQDLFGMTQSTLNAMGYSHNRLYKSIRITTQPGQPVQRETFFNEALFWLCTFILLIPCALAALILSLFKTGGTIEVWGTKPD